MTLASGQTSRKVVGIATIAISSGTSAMNERKTKMRTISAPRAATASRPAAPAAAAVGRARAGRRGR